MIVGRTLLVLMARWPASLRCKTRLAAGGLGPQRAAAVQRRLLDHTLTVLDQAGTLLGASARLALTGAGPRAGARLLTGAARTQLVLQGAGGLGLRLQRQFSQGFRQGFEQVLVLGSDLPQLASSDVQQALRALQHKPLVLGPALDGGYWLVGLRQPAPTLFAGIDWGGPQVLAQTLAAAGRLGLAPALLADQGDLDRVQDLQRWR